MDTFWSFWNSLTQGFRENLAAQIIGGVIAALIVAIIGFILRGIFGKKESPPAQTVQLAQQNRQTQQVLVNVAPPQPASLYSKQHREEQIKPFLELVRTWLGNPNRYGKFTEKGFTHNLPIDTVTGKEDQKLREDAEHFIELIINQHTNSQESISFRHQVLSSAFMLAFPDLLLLDNQRDFTYEQRLAIYRKYNGICQWVDSDGTRCGVRCTWSDWHADHVVAWSRGGPTTVANGQVLCPRHNLAKGADLPIVPASSTVIAKPTESLHVASDKPKATIAAGTEPRYTAVLGQLRNLGWQPDQLLGHGRTSHKLNPSGTVLAILRHAMKQQKGTSDFYFFGLSPMLFEKCSTQSKVYVFFFECGSPSSVLILPGEQLRRYFEGIPTGGSAKEWKINIFSNGKVWKLQPSGKPRIDVTSYLNCYPTPDAI